MDQQPCLLPLSAGFSSPPAQGRSRKEPGKSVPSSRGNQGLAEATHPPGGETWPISDHKHSVGAGRTQYLLVTFLQSIYCSISFQMIFYTYCFYSDIIIYARFVTCSGIIFCYFFVPHNVVGMAERYSVQGYAVKKKKLFPVIFTILMNIIMK